MVANRKNKTTSSRNKIAPGAARTANQAPLPVDESLTVESAESQVDVQTTEKPTVEPTIEPTIVTLDIKLPIAVITDEPMTAVDMSVIEPIVGAVVEPIVEPIIEATIVDEDKVHEDKPSAIPSTSRNKSKVSTAKSVQRTKGDKIMTQDAAKSSPVVAKKESAIAVTGSALPVRPVTPNALNFVGMISSAGNRPIGASTVVVFSTYLNGRPIEASSLKLFEMLPGDRPVFANEVSYVAGTADGGRPIMISPAGLMNAGEVMGTRPIFSNDIVDPDSASLMGYLD